MKLIYTFLMILYLGTTGSVYDYSITDINGNVINLSDFRGKKILFVNTATNSPYVNEYGGLEQLYEKFQDSLVIIATPSNDFGNEPLDNDSIKNFVLNNYNIHYILAAKASLRGDSIAPVYQWLTDSSLNHVFLNPVNGEFFKYLVDENGELISVADGAIDPMDSSLQNLVQKHYQLISTPAPVRDTIQIQ